MSLARTVLGRVGRRGGQEHGAVLVIVAGCMVLFLGLLAYTIDLGSGRQAQQKTQVAADAGAEAAANAIGQGSTPAAAALIATNIATTNDPGSTVGVVNPTGTTVTVNVSGASAGTFSSSKRESSLAVATPGQVTQTSVGTVITTASGCTSAGGNCLAIFAMGTSCGGDSSDGSDPVVIGGGVTITGGAWSNGSIDLGGGGSTFGPVTYANGCSASPAGATESGQTYLGDHYNNGLPATAPTATTWPLNYATDFPACSGTSCTGPCANGDSTCATTEHTPSFCTIASDASSWSIDTYTAPYTLITHQIYCAVGGGDPNTPSTWTGTLTVSGGGSSMDSTFVAGSITVGGGSTLTPCGYNLPDYSASDCSSAVPAPSTPNYPLFYAINGTVNESSGGNGLTGDWFVPNGSISVGGGTTFVGFLEAQTVNLSSGGIQGDGPVDNGSTYGVTDTSTTTTTKVISQGSHLTG